jgi:hypothetical protein
VAGVRGGAALPAPVGVVLVLVVSTVRCAVRARVNRVGKRRVGKLRSVAVSSLSGTMARFAAIASLASAFFFADSFGIRLVPSLRLRRISIRIRIPHHDIIVAQADRYIDYHLPDILWRACSPGDVAATALVRNMCN